MLDCDSFWLAGGPRCAHRIVAGAAAALHVGRGAVCELRPQLIRHQYVDARRQLPADGLHHQRRDEDAAAGLPQDIADALRRRRVESGDGRARA